MHEVTGVTIPEMRTMLKATLNSGKAIVRLIKSITLKLWMETFKRDMAVTPLRPIDGEKAYQRA